MAREDDEPEEDDGELFRRAMRDVQPLKRPLRVAPVRRAPRARASFARAERACGAAGNPRQRRRPVRRAAGG